MTDSEKEELRKCLVEVDEVAMTLSYADGSSQLREQLYAQVWTLKFQFRAVLFYSE